MSEQDRPKPEDHRLPLPEPMPVVRENGDAVVELRQDGELVGEVNFSKILGNWFSRLGMGKSRHLKSV